LAEDEGCTARRAALLAVGIGEDRAFTGDAVDIRRPIAHQTHGVGADLRHANVVAEDDEDVRLAAGGGRRRRWGRRLLLLLRLRHLRRSTDRERSGCEGRAAEQHLAAVHCCRISRDLAMIASFTHSALPLLISGFLFARPVLLPVPAPLHLLP